MSTPTASNNRHFAWLLAASLSACGTQPNPAYQPQTGSDQPQAPVLPKPMDHNAWPQIEQFEPRPIDGDGDGQSSEQGDCNDSDSAIFRGAVELPDDGVDQDCDGEDLVSPQYRDNDNDGYTRNAGDCDDDDALVNPAGVEICDDGTDQDCNGTDQACSELDGDQDGFTTKTGDCNDSDDAIHPDADEIHYNGVDDDCDATTPDDDLDGDGFLSTHDCNDANAGQNPAAQEIAYDGIDQNCSGSDLVDVDGDGYIATKAGGNDCDDNDATLYPGQPCEDSNVCTFSDTCRMNGECRGYDQSGWIELTSLNYKQTGPNHSWAEAQHDAFILRNEHFSAIRVRGETEGGGYCYAHWGSGRVARYRFVADGGIFSLDSRSYGPEQCPARPPVFSNTGQAKICQYTDNKAAAMTLGAGDAKGLALSSGTKIKLEGRHLIPSQGGWISCRLEAKCK